MAMTADEVRASKRAFMARKRAEDPEAARKQNRDWHANNRDYSRAKMRDYYARRFFWGKAMKLRGPDRATYKDVAHLWHEQRGRCALTGRPLTREGAQLDHIIPKTRGGGDNVENLQWLCREANIAKRAMTDDEFIALCSDVMRWIGERIAAVQRETPPTCEGVPTSVSAPLREHVAQ